MASGSPPAARSSTPISAPTPADSAPGAADSVGSPLPIWGEGWGEGITELSIEARAPLTPPLSAEVGYIRLRPLRAHSVLVDTGMRSKVLGLREVVWVI